MSLHVHARRFFAVAALRSVANRRRDIMAHLIVSGADAAPRSVCIFRARTELRGEPREQPEAILSQGRFVRLARWHVKKSLRPFWSEPIVKY